MRINGACCRVDSVIDIIQLNNVSKIVNSGSEKLTILQPIYLTIPRGQFVFLCGALILAGSVAMTKYQRLYEAAILKTLGARKKLIIYITLIEYGVLGALAGSIGSAAAIGLTWAICKYDMKIDWSLEPMVNITGVALTLLLVAAVGVLSSWDIMVKKPLGILRAE